MASRALLRLSIAVVGVLAASTPRARADAPGAQFMIELGQQQSDAGNFCDAFKSYYQASAQQDSPSSALRFAVARAAYKAGIWDQALVALEAFLRSEPDDSAKQLATNWLSEATAHVVRCHVLVDGVAPFSLELASQASRPAEAGYSACTRDSRVMVDSEDGAVLLAAGWSYEISGRANGKSLHTLQIYMPNVLTAGAVPREATLREAHSCNLRLQTREETLPPLRSAIVAPAVVQPAPLLQREVPTQTSPAVPERGIPLLSYLAWGAGVAALAGAGIALAERAAEIERWNSVGCLKSGGTRVDNCSDHRDAYRTAGYWALGTGIGAVALASFGGLVWFLDAQPDRPASGQSSCWITGARADCVLRF